MIYSFRHPKYRLAERLAEAAANLPKLVEKLKVPRKTKKAKPESALQFIDVPKISEVIRLSIKNAGL